MPAPYSDFLQQIVSGNLQPWTSVWVRLVSNNTGTAYVSTAATTSLGKFSFTTIPGDNYTVYTGPTATGAWTGTGDTSYTVPYVAGDDAAFKSVTDLVSGPYASNATAGYVDALIADRGGQVFNVKSLLFGAKGDGKAVADGAMTSASPTLTSASGLFLASDAGKAISVQGCGVAGAPLVTTVLAYVNATTLTLNANAGAGGPFSAKAVRWGTNDSAAIQATVTAAGVGGTVYFPQGNYILSTTPVLPLDRQSLQGEGAGFTTLTPFAPTGGGFGDGIRVAQASGAYYNGLNVFDLVIDGVCQQTPGNGITAVGIHNFVIERCQIKNCSSYGINLSSISAGSVLGLGTQLQHARLKDCYVTGSRANDNFGGGGLVEAIFDRCWSDNPITNGFDLTNMTDCWFLTCRVTATSGTPTAYASDFGSAGVHYLDCIASGAGIQNGFAMTGDRLNAASQGATSKISYTACHVISIANQPFFFKSVAAGDGITGITMNGCSVDSTAARGVYAQGVKDLHINGNLFNVGGAQYGVTLDSEGGGGAPCVDVEILWNNLTGTLGVQQLSVSTGACHFQDANGNFLGPIAWNNLAGTNNNLNFADNGDVTIGRGNLNLLGTVAFIQEIRDTRQTPTEAVLVSGVNAKLGVIVGVTLTAARVVGAPLNSATGQRLAFTLIQSGAGAFAVTWNAAFKGITGGTSGATGTRATFIFNYDGTNWNLEGAQPTWVA